MKTKFLLLFLSLILSIYSFAGDNDTGSKHKVRNTSGIGVAIKLTSLGPGIEISKAFYHPFNIRLGATYFGNKSDLSKYLPDGEYFYNELRIGTVSLIGDWQFRGIFHASLGAFYNYSEEYYEHDYPSYNPPTIVNKVRFNVNKINPYIGVGFGRSISKKRLLSFGLDFGILYIGKIKYSIETNDPDYEKPEDIIKPLDKIERFQFYPYLNFQLSFRLFTKIKHYY